MFDMGALFQPTGPRSVKQEKIEVTINPEIMVDGFAEAICREAQRKDPLRFKDTPLEPEAMKRYCRGLLKCRVDSVDETKVVSWREMKNLWIPDFIQMSMSMIGEVVIKESGIKLVPVMDWVVDMKEMKIVSEQLQQYEDHLHVHRDAFPREREGNLDVMSTALINDYVRSLRQATHPADTYVAAFLGFKLKEETTFQILYRINYDDLTYVSESVASIRGDLI